MLAHFQRGYAVNLVKPTYLAAGTDKAEIVLADYKIRVENSKAVYMKSQRTKSYSEGSSQQNKECDAAKYTTPSTRLQCSSAKECRTCMKYREIGSKAFPSSFTQGSVSSCM